MCTADPLLLSYGYCGTITMRVKVNVTVNVAVDGNSNGEREWLKQLGGWTVTFSSTSNVGTPSFGDVYSS
jgi:hypothetical protein